ncbi:ATP-binding cassette subfamily A (ABC1) member 3 [Fasciola hepatica]|uniref:ATP-binding cassette subfamily A (ABC1) member 3 n=1 Tax=Fasciola hepatica TaxID=6192 RepID=A0A4E0S3A3_FASHE|nr:ATP-binding cassette subfamily A (ABC1) member 3 [Fasciola hepatica]
MKHCRRLAAVLVKNFKVLQRGWISTSLACFLPLILIFVLIYLRSQTERTKNQNVTKWREFTPDKIPPSSDERSRQKLAFSPKCSLYENVMRRIMLNVDMVGFPDEKTMVSYLLLNDSAKDFLGALVYDDRCSPGNFSYTIRLRNKENWFTYVLYPTFIQRRPRSLNYDASPPDYYSKGFLAIQNAVDRAVTSHLCGQNPEVEFQLYLKRMPFPPYLKDFFIDVIQSKLSDVIVLGIFFPVLHAIRLTLTEKQRGIKESLRMVGVSSFLYWSSWMITFLALMIAICLVITAFLCIDLTTNGAVVPLSNPVIIAQLLIVYSFNLLAFGFFLSALFKSAHTGTALSSAIMMLIYLPYSLLAQHYHEIGLVAKLIFSLVPSIGMGFAGMLIGKFEGRGLGVQFSNLFIPASQDDDLCLIYVGICMFCSAIWFLILTFYVDSVWPGPFGVSKRWYFPFVYLCRHKPSVPVVLDSDEAYDTALLLGQPSHSDRYRRRRAQKSGGQVIRSHCSESQSATQSVDEESNPCRFLGTVKEPEPVGLPIGISVQKLSKIYSSKGHNKTAVSNLSMNLFQGQITVLLGHNGAGKTTTLSILTGLFAPTSGTAFVNGHDIRTDIEGVRESLGFCPQFDVLFDSLTVEEHLRLYGKLKGLRGQAVQEQVVAVMTQINLLSKRRCLIGSLSGGMQRRLSVGMALIGSSQVVILDEPTSGLDPEARRQIWDILLKERNNRTVLVTTHYMDEADHLGDRIAIMADGKLRCLGSPLYLKAKYGAGYLLTVKRLAETSSGPLVAQIHRHIPEASLRSDHGEEVRVLLPLESANRFPALFADLEACKQALGACSFGISVTTMEEVFFRVSESESHGAMSFGLAGVSRSTSETELPSTSGYRTDTCSVAGASVAGLSSYTYTDTDMIELRKRGCSLYWSQLSALLIKRGIYLKRHRILLLSQLLIPVVLTTVGLLVFRQMAYNVDSVDPRIRLSLDSFGSPLVVSEANNDLSTETHDLAEQFLETYTAQFDSAQVRSWRIRNASAFEETLSTQVAEPTFSVYISEYIVGLVMKPPTTVKKRNATLSAQLFFQGESFHALPTALNTFANARLQFLVKRSAKYPHECPLLKPDTKLARLDAFNQPLPLTDQDRAARMDSIDGLQRVVIAGFPLVSALLLAMSFAGASFGPAIIHEYVTKAKHLQFVSGVKMFSYWFANFIWDTSVFLLICATVLSVFAAFNVDAYATRSRLHLVLFLLLGYVWAVLPEMYLLARLFKSPISGLVWLLVINEMTGISLFLLTALLCYPTIHQQPLAIRIQDSVRFLSPSFCVCEGLFTVFMNYQFRRLCAQPGMDFFCEFIDPKSPCCLKTCTPFCAYWTDAELSFQQGAIGKHLLAFGIQGAVFYTLVLFLDTVCARRLQRLSGCALDFFLCSCRRFGICCYTCSPSSRTERGELTPSDQDALVEDQDVSHHRHLVESMPLSRLKDQACLVVRRLIKTYDSVGRSSGRPPAVDRITMAVLPGECFGLLGVNGAGKTTTFRMITGDLDPSDGLILTNGYDMNLEWRQAQQSIGYCPQFDALLTYLTGRETLEFYGRLRGQHDGLLRVEVERLLEELHLTHHADVAVKYYSGGKRRKLSVAVALLGDSPLLCLDEPTAGVDPISRRLVWNAIIRHNQRGRTVLLSSHSMEECEVLCSRVAIMVNGRFKCLGTCQHLKDRFGRGYSLAIQVSAPTHTPSECDSPAESCRSMDSSSSFTFDPDTQDADNLMSQVALNDVVNQTMRFVAQSFPEARLVDRHQGLLQYHFPLPARGNLDLGRIFGLLEENKSRLNVINYSVSQTSLEQIFIDLAKLQQTSPGPVVDSGAWFCFSRGCCPWSVPRRSGASEELA